METWCGQHGSASWLATVREAQLYLDMDGVIFDFIGAAIAVHQAHGRLTHLRGWEDWRHWSEYRKEMTDEEFWSPIDTSEFWARLRPYDGALQAFHKLRSIVRQGD
ncbi:MAG: hypothetical protein KatS3mg109_0085 [Pirellulaceae bacterium]|nr:MAG: hypothetical protein KatS3mg109_0085 [Pirellulaceae bacterium]